MHHVEILNNERHKDTRVRANFSPGLGYDIGAVMLLPNEIVEAQREYVILFRKHPNTGAFFINALLGFEENENLFLSELYELNDSQSHPHSGWCANHVPWSFSKGPLLISFENGAADKPILSIIESDPRVSDTEGERLFNVDGSPTKYLNTVNSVLAATHDGIQQLDSMIDAFIHLGLIEALSLDIRLNNGKEIKFAGAYTIAEERLRELSAEDLLSLNKAGYLSSAFYIAHSLGNLRKLIDMKNKIL